MRKTFTLIELLVVIAIIAILAAMLRIPVDMCNVPKEDIFRPTMWQRLGNDDFRACQYLGPLYL